MAFKMETDWQIDRTRIKDRSKYILQTRKMADCRFLVGTSPNQRLIYGHKLILAMASPVFEVMFYGSLPEKKDPICIPDVVPCVFEALLYYIYNDKISINCFDHACQLSYLADIYMLPHVVEHCIDYIRTDLSPKNACRVYEFAKLFEKPRLLERSMEIIVAETLAVIKDPSFMDIEGSTLMAILDQNRLNIDSEVDLFNCLLKIANERGILNDGDKNKADSDYEDASGVVAKKFKLDTVASSLVAASTPAGTCGNVLNVAAEVIEVDSSASASGNAGESAANITNFMDAQRTTMDQAMLRQAVKKIRFLTMTPQQFSEGPGLSKLLTRNEALAISINISSSTIKNIPMPEGFSQSNKRRRASNYDNIKYHCVSASIKYDIANNRPFYKKKAYESGLLVNVDTNIYLQGVQLKLDDVYKNVRIEGFSVCIQNMKGSEIARTSCIKNRFGAMFKLIFHRIVPIRRNQNYYIKIINLHGYSIQMNLWDPEVNSNGIKFRILPPNLHKIDFSSTIGRIIFTT